MNFIGPSVPDMELLATQAPYTAWVAARKQALRSPMIRYRVGAVIFDPSTGRVVGRGCSHPDIAYSRASTSIHAEHHALRNSNHLELEGHWIVILTLNGGGGHSYTSRPCYSCARALFRAGITKAIYPERSARRWLIRAESPEQLLARAPVPTGPYARQQRIPA